MKEPRKISLDDAMGHDGASVSGPLLDAFILPFSDWVPNNPKLPVLHYHGVLDASDIERRVDVMEATFTRNGWPPQWRNGVYRYHHYHTSAHEVLGIAAGSIRLMLGGPGGREVRAHTGDVVVLPAGTGHCCIEASSDCVVIGAYPLRQWANTCLKAPNATMAHEILYLPFPPSDPVAGPGGALTRLWAPISG